MAHDITHNVNILNRFWVYYQNFDIVFLITGNADMIYNIRNRNEMTDQNQKLSRNNANLANRKEIDNNRKISQKIMSLTPKS
jgi:hypothetical protein